jgi:hypothetical protein
MFRISRLQLEIKLLDENAPPGFWGSRLRGGYGRVLKDHLCDYKEVEDCRTCPRFGECDYPRLFEPQRAAEESRKAEAPREMEIRFATPVRIGKAPFRDFYGLVYQLCNRAGGLWQLYGEDWPGQGEFHR